MSAKQKRPTPSVEKTDGDVSVQDQANRDWISVGDLVSQGVSIAQIATVIEQYGVYCWDAFGRRVLANEGNEGARLSKASVLILLAVCNEANVDAYISYERIGHIDRLTNEHDSPLQNFGWSAEEWRDLDEKTGITERENEQSDNRKEIGISKQIWRTNKQILAANWPRVTDDSLKRRLSDPPDWLKPARIHRGKAGRCSALWNPALIALGMATPSKGKTWTAGKDPLDRVIQNHFGDFYEEWLQYAEQL